MNADALLLYSYLMRQDIPFTSVTPPIVTEHSGYRV